MKDEGMLAIQWAMYSRLAVPNDASPDEIAAIRHSFYTGAAAIMILNRRLCMDDVSVAEGKATIAGVTEELGEFFAGRPASGVTH